MDAIDDARSLKVRRGLISANALPCRVTIRLLRVFDARANSSVHLAFLGKRQLLHKQFLTISPNEARWRS